MNYLQKIITRTLLRSIGKTYDGTGLSKTNAHNTPIHMFSDWFQQTLKAAPDQANIMTVSTVSASGMPRSRLVLLKHFDEKGFVFYTNYNSAKAKELQ
jgi:pyridoxamine 5'-phosphate oxidase